MYARPPETLTVAQPPKRSHAMPRNNDWSRTKKMECRRCGGMVEKPFGYYGKPYHEDCAVAEMEDCMIQMHSRSGPYWEAWLAAGGYRGRRKRGANPINKGLLIFAGQSGLPAPFSWYSGLAGAAPPAGRLAVSGAPERPGGLFFEREGEWFASQVDARAGDSQVGSESVQCDRADDGGSSRRDAGSGGCGGCSCGQVAREGDGE